MFRQWIAGAAFFTLVSGYSWAEVAQPGDCVLKDAFSKQYHGVLKLNSVTLKILIPLVIRPPGLRRATSLPVMIFIPASVWLRIITLWNVPDKRSTG